MWLSSPREVILFQGNALLFGTLSFPEYLNNFAMMSTDIEEAKLPQTRLGNLSVRKQDSLQNYSNGVPDNVAGGKAHSLGSTPLHCIST